MKNLPKLNVANVVFILGAPDPEMNLIEQLLTRAGFLYGYAMRDGNRVTASRAYMGDDVQPVAHSELDRNLHDWKEKIKTLDSDLQVITIECAVIGVLVHRRIDHHGLGDPGYGKRPEEFFEGSSIGQLYNLLTEELGVSTDLFEDMFWEIKLAAAADHCLSHAYAGRCPGIHPGELALWRAISRAEFQLTKPRVILNRVAAAKKEILRLVEARIGEHTFRIAGRKKIPELPEASAQLGIPVHYEMVERDGRVKVGILGGSPELIRAWMEDQRIRLADIYGDMERGYAGGYVATKQMAQ